MVMIIVFMAFLIIVLLLNSVYFVLFCILLTFFTGDVRDGPYPIQELLGIHQGSL